MGARFICERGDIQCAVTSGETVKGCGEYGEWRMVWRMSECVRRLSVCSVYYEDIQCAECSVETDSMHSEDSHCIVHCGESHCAVCSVETISAQCVVQRLSVCNVNTVSVEC